MEVDNERVRQSNASLSFNYRPTSSAGHALYFTSYVLAWAVLNVRFSHFVHNLFPNFAWLLNELNKQSNWSFQLIFSVSRNNLWCFQICYITLSSNLQQIFYLFFLFSSLLFLPSKLYEDQHSNRTHVDVFGKKKPEGNWNKCVERNE